MVNMHAVRKTKTCYLRTALFACLMLHPGCISLWGPDCRSWSTASRATSMRNALNSFGVGWDFVIQGNLMASRRGLVTDGCFTSLFKIAGLKLDLPRLVLCLLCILAVHGFYVVEQPRTAGAHGFCCAGVCARLSAGSRSSSNTSGGDGFRRQSPMFLDFHRRFWTEEGFLG